MADDLAVEEMRDEVLAAWDGVDIVINNAGVASAGTVADTSLEDWRWTLNSNFMGVVRGTRAFLPVLLRQGQGRIVNIASFAGIANAPSMGAYSASKAAVISLSETLRAELALSAVGIKVSVVCPAFFKTSLMTTARASAASSCCPAPASTSCRPTAWRRCSRRGWRTRNRWCSRSKPAAGRARARRRPAWKDSGRVDAPASTGSCAACRSRGSRARSCAATRSAWR
jgi:NAD(P)-dependent dehydrogenase (short-subunit alcohol dehydrogenase family)